MNPLHRYLAALNHNKSNTDTQAQKPKESIAITSFCSSLTPPSPTSRVRYSSQTSRKNNIRNIPHDCNNNELENNTILLIKRNDVSGIAIVEEGCTSNIERNEDYIGYNQNEESFGRNNLENNFQHSYIHAVESSASNRNRNKFQPSYSHNAHVPFKREENEVFYVSNSSSSDSYNETASSFERYRNFENNASMHDNLKNIFREKEKVLSSTSMEYSSNNDSSAAMSYSDSNIADNGGNDGAYEYCDAPKLWRDALRKKSTPKIHHLDNDAHAYHEHQIQIQSPNSSSSYPREWSKPNDSIEKRISNRSYINNKNESTITPTIHTKSSKNVNFYSDGTIPETPSKTVKMNNTTNEIQSPFHFLKDSVTTSPTSNITSPTTATTTSSRSSSILNSPFHQKERNNPFTTPMQRTHMRKTNINDIPPPPEPSDETTTDTNVRTNSYSSKLSTIQQRINAYEQKLHPKHSQSKNDDGSSISPPSSVAMEAADAAASYLQKQEENSQIHLSKEHIKQQSTNKQITNMQMIKKIISIQLHKHTFQIMSRLDSLEHRLDVLEDQINYNNFH